MKRKPELSFWQIWNLSFGFLGVQIGYSLQNSNTSSIFESLGADVSHLSYFWLAAPVAGMLIQPIIGMFSDGTWTRFGRRIPYILEGGIISTIALLLMPNCPMLLAFAPLAMGAFILLFMDLSFNVTMQPFRAPVMWNRDGSGLADGSLSGKVDMSMLSPEISVEAQEADDGSILNVYRTFSRLRNTYPALAQGTMEKHPVYNGNNPDAPQIAAWYMVCDAWKMLVVHNFGEKAFILTLTDDLSRPVGLLGSAETKTADGVTRLMLGPLSSAVFEL